MPATTARLGGAGPWVLALPMTYVAGLQVVCRSLAAGYRPVLLDDHGSLAAAVAAAGGAPYVSLVATQLLRALRSPAETAALAACAAVLVGGGPVDRELREQAAAAGIRVVATYGSAETAGGCVYDGLPLDGVAVAIGSNGRIRIGGRTLFDGYDGDPALHGGGTGRRVVPDRRRADGSTRTGASRCSAGSTTWSSRAASRCRPASSPPGSASIRP